MGTVPWARLCHPPEAQLIRGGFANHREAGPWVTTIQSYDPRQSGPVHTSSFQGST
jgi:hypothetical protein